MADNSILSSYHVKNGGWLSAQNPKKVNNRREKKTRRPFLRQTQMKEMMRESVQLTMTKLDELPESTPTTTRQSSLLSFVTKADSSSSQHVSKLDEVNSSVDKVVNHHNKCEVDYSACASLLLRPDEDFSVDDCTTAVTVSVSDQQLSHSDCDISHAVLKEQVCNFKKECNSKTKSSEKPTQNDTKCEKISELFVCSPSSSFQDSGGNQFFPEKENQRKIRKTLSLKSSSELISSSRCANADLKTFDIEQNRMNISTGNSVPEEESFPLLSKSKETKESEFPDSSVSLELVFEGCSSKSRRGLQKQMPLISSCDSSSCDAKDFSLTFEDASLIGDETGITLGDTEKSMKEKYKQMMGTLVFSNNSSGFL